MHAWLPAILHNLAMGGGTVAADAQVAWKTQAATGNPTGSQGVTGRPPNP